MSLVLVTGASGYVGSIVCRALCDAGFDVVGADRAPPPPHHPIGEPGVRRCDVADPVAFRAAVRGLRPSAVVHLAGVIEVETSVRDPVGTYRNNLGATLSVLEIARNLEIGAVVFSSSAAVYGAPVRTPILEDAPLAPTHPYGASKAMSERMIEDASVHGIRSCSLRYFNAAGASTDGTLGERHDPETHLIPNVLRAALGTGPPVAIFGRGFPTRDGTAIRDYVHVEDLARAHVLALRRLLEGKPSAALNLGTGSGATVLEVVAACERVLGSSVPRTDAPARLGDPPALTASCERAAQELGWRPERSDLLTIVEDVLRFERGRSR